MKKQILFLAMSMLSLIFAGTTNVLGQIVYPNYVQGTPVCVEAQGLSCFGGATGAPELNPTPGVTYNYEISIDPTAVESVLWYVTDNPNVITVVGAASVLTAADDRDADDGEGNYILDAEDDAYNLDIPLASTMDLDISWKNFDGSTNQVMLVAYVEGADGCSDNIQVWRIEPVFNFTLDVLSMFDNGELGSEAVPASECVSPIESAVYNGTSLGMDYGRNFIFFSVNAANFVHSWQPTLSATVTYGTPVIAWAYPDQAELNADGVASGTWNAATDPVLASSAADEGVVGSTGECIVVRVEIDNGILEGIVDNVVTLSVNGVMYDPIAENYANTTLQDMDEPVSGTGSCVNDLPDEAIYNITARPAITEGTPTTALGPFEPKD